MNSLIRKEQLKLKIKGEQILCQTHKEHITLLNISQNQKLGERLICGSCDTSFDLKFLQLKGAEDLLYKLYQQEQQTTIQLDLIKYNDQINTIETLLKEVQKGFQKLVTSLQQQLTVNKEKLKELEESKSKTELSQLIEKIDSSQVLTDETLQKTAEFISNLSIVNGKFELKEKVQISDSSIKSIQESIDRMSAYLNSIKTVLQQGGNLNAEKGKKNSIIPPIQKQQQQQILLDYDTFNYKNPIYLDEHNDQILAVAMSNNDQLMASGDCAGQILLWELDQKSLKQKYQGENEIQDLIFSPDDKLLAAGQKKFPYDILIFNLSTPNSNQPDIRLKGHSNSVLRIVFTSNSQFMLSGSIDQTLKIWSLTQKKSKVTQNLSNCIYGVNISQDQKYISACCYQGYVHLFNSTNIQSLKEIAQWKAHQDYAYGTTFTPDSTMLLTCGKDDIRLWSITQLLSTDLQKSLLKVYKTESDCSYFWSIQTRLNGSLLISNDEKIRIWNLESGKLIQTLDVPVGYQNIVIIIKLFNSEIKISQFLKI